MRMLLWPLLALVACDPGAFGPKPELTDAGVSPGTSTLPRLDDPAEKTPDGGLLKTRPPDASTDAAAPEPPRALPTARRLPNDRLVAREVSGIVLEGGWRHAGVPAPIGEAGIDADALKAAQAKTEGGWTVTLGPEGRMRLEVKAQAQPLAPGTVLLGRRDRLGWVVVWPRERRYRVIPEGAGRALLAESRVDVSPTSLTGISQGPDGERFELATHTIVVETSMGDVALESVSLPEVRGSGVPLCRLLVSVAGASPNAATCPPDAVPLRATYRWMVDGELVVGSTFEASSLSRRTDLPSPRFTMPPKGADHTPTGLPLTRRGMFHSDEELAGLRSETGALPNPPDPAAPQRGLRAINRSDRFLYLWLDGLAIATVDPWSERAVGGLRPGRYRVQWRTFLGDVVGEVSEHDLPAQVLFGEPLSDDKPDAG
jgi:hypothetical protein